MKIKKESEDAFVMNLSRTEAEIFINSMNETIRRIPAREYQTRMGAEISEIQQIVALLEAALK